MIPLSRIDLNLLHLLLEVHDAGSVSKAGRRLGLSQPAASNALSRLRDALGDPLFLRSKDGMVPTAYVARIAPQIRDHLGGITSVLSENQAFVPETSNRIFRLSLSDVGEQIFLPPIAHRLAKLAPNVALENISAPIAELADSLAAQDADVAIGIVNPRDTAIRSAPLFNEVYCAVGNVALTESEIAGLDLHDKRIILVAPSATYAADVEALLDRHGFSRNISYRLRTFGALPDLLRRIDAIAILPKQLAQRLENAGAARMLPQEIPLGTHTVKLVWHRKSENDPGCVWLRQQIRELFGTDGVRA